jgi:hypothetical protein
MLIIREPQMAALAEDLCHRFEDRAFDHVQRYFPQQCDAVGESATRYYVAEGIHRARRYGLESEYDLLRFINLIFAFGSDFDSRAEHAWMLEFLNDSELWPTARMDALMAALLPETEPQEIVEEPAPEEYVGESEEEEFDGIVWEDDNDPNYVPVSIEPEIEPWERGPAPGTVPMEPWEEEDDWQGEWIEEEERGGQ